MVKAEDRTTQDSASQASHTADHQTLQFISFIHTHTPEGTFTSIDGKTLDGHWETDTLPVEELKKLASTLPGISREQKTDFFTRISPMKKKPERGRGKESDSAGSSVLWVDLDPYKLQKTQDDAIAVLEAFVPRPTLIVNSGGGIHGYWLVDKFCDDLLHIKESNAWLQRQFSNVGADSVYDLARVMRIPGTYNYKESHPDGILAFIHTLEADRIYNLDEFERFVIEGGIQDEEYTPDPVPDDFEELEGVSEALWGRIFSEDTALKYGARRKDDGGVDRSLNDWVIATSMLSLGFTAENCAYVLTHPTWFSGDKFQTTHSVNYVDRTISKAMHKVVSDQQTSAGRRSKKPKKPTVQQWAESIQANNDLNFARGRDYELLLYNRGAYRPESTELREIIFKEMYPDWTTHLRDEVLAAWLDNAPLAPEIPPLDEICALNGVLDVETMTLREHSPADIFTVQLPIHFQVGMDCPVTDRVYEEVQGDNAPLLFEITGYLALPNTSFHKAFMSVGDGSNGKSVVMDQQVAFLGKENVRSFELKDFANSQFNSAYLYGAMANICTDIAGNHIRDSALLKKIIAGELITAQRKRGHPFGFTPFARMLFSANSMPTFSDMTYAQRRRYIILPYTRVFKGDDADKQLGKKLSTPEELSGLLNRSLAAYKRLLKNGKFHTTGAVEEAHRVFVETSDPVPEFVRERTKLGSEFTIPKPDLYLHFKSHVTDQGRGVISARKFNERLKAHLPELVIRKSDGVEIWQGIRINELAIDD